MNNNVVNYINSRSRDIAVKHAILSSIGHAHFDFTARSHLQRARTLVCPFGGDKRLGNIPMSCS